MSDELQFSAILQVPYVPSCEDPLRQVALLFCFFSATATLGAIGIQDLTITNVYYQAIVYKPTLPGFLTSADPYGISNSGTVVGDYSYHLGNTYDFGGFTYGNGTLTKFAYPSVSTYLLPSGINDNGVIILSSDQLAYGFVGKPGAFTQIAFPGATQTMLNGINDAGVVVGTYADSSGYQHGFIYNPNGTYTSFDGPSNGFLGTELTGINNQGDLIGISNNQPFIFTNGSFDLLFGDRPTSINDNDQILFPNAYHGSDILDYKTNTLEIIQGINGGIQAYQGRMNDAGVIAGGNTGYLLLPTPEPATFLLALPALVGVAWLAKRRGK